MQPPFVRTLRQLSARSCNHEDAQIYTPPYLLNADGSNATRPTLMATSRTVAVGGTITATTSELISKFSLIRSGCAAHGGSMQAWAASASGLFLAQQYAQACVCPWMCR